LLRDARAAHLFYFFLFLLFLKFFLFFYNDKKAFQSLKMTDKNEDRTTLAILCICIDIAKITMITVINCGCSYNDKKKVERHSIRSIEQYLGCVQEQSTNEL